MTVKDLGGATTALGYEGTYLATGCNAANTYKCSPTPNAPTGTFGCSRSAATTTNIGLVTPSPTSCPSRIYTDDEVKRAVSFTSKPASDFWCGNLYKLTRPLSPTPDTASTNCGAACCGLGVGDDGKSIIAHERAEVRGWITAWSGISADEGEYTFAIVPDFDWSTDAPGVEPINSVEKYLDLTTPTTNDGSTQIKVELNSWEPARSCGVQRAPGGTYQAAVDSYMNQGRFCDEFTLRRPADWCYPTSRQFAYAPFSLADAPHESGTGSGGPFQEGDYVRMVGTLWEDQPHGGDECWNQIGSRTQRRGNLEMHSVDFMARLRAPPDRTPFEPRVTVLSLCTIGRTQGHVEVRPKTPKPPHSRARLAMEKKVAAFTNDWSILSDRKSFDDPTKVVVDVEVAGRGANERGLFFAGYTARWEACTPDCTNRCNGQFDGCDGKCGGPPCNHNRCPPAGDPNATFPCTASPTGCAASHAECQKLHGH